MTPEEFDKMPNKFHQLWLFPFTALQDLKKNNPTNYESLRDLCLDTDNLQAVEIDNDRINLQRKQPSLLSPK